MHNKYPNIFWLPDDRYAKAMFHFRTSLDVIAEPLRIYGLEPYVDGAKIEIIRLTEDYGLVVRGIDKQISVDYIRRGR